MEVPDILLPDIRDQPMRVGAYKMALSMNLLKLQFLSPFYAGEFSDLKGQSEIR